MAAIFVKSRTEIFQLKLSWHSPNPFTEQLPALIYLTSFAQEAGVSRSPRLDRAGGTYSLSGAWSLTYCLLGVD